VNELSNLILPAVDFEIDDFWSGIMAFGPDKRPLIDRHITGIGYAVGLGGMGVALGSLAGDRLARILCLTENS
jgi:glycine/D-amino acid oxidase-like deaminating enzyme